MPNKIIEEIYRARLFDDSKEQIKALFDSEAWKSQPLSTYYGNGPDGELSVDISVLRAMNEYCNTYERILGGPNKTWLLSMIKTTTIVHKADDLGSAIELMSTAAQHTTPSRKTP